MQYLLTQAYARTGLIAVANASLDGAYDQAISELIKEEFKGDIFHEEAVELLKLAKGSAKEAAKLVRESVIPEQKPKLKIIDMMPFVITQDLQVGIASDGTYAAQAWRISDEAFNSIGGQKFSWIGPDGNIYVDHRDSFKRPNEFQIMSLITPVVAKKAIQLGLMEVVE